MSLAGWPRFSLPGGSELKGEPWVAVDIGPANWPEDLEGWLIEDAPKEILLLDWYGEVHTLRKPAPAEKRPKLKEEKDGAVLWDSEADHSVAWNVRKEDYNAKSKKFLADGLPQDKNEDRIFGFVNRRFGLAYHIVNAARYAHFAHQFGQKDHAEAFYSHALKAYKKYADHYLGGFDQSAVLPVFVASQIALGYRNWAISSANNGASREELKTQWERNCNHPLPPIPGRGEGDGKALQEPSGGRRPVDRTGCGEICKIHDRAKNRLLALPFAGSRC